jgi:anti-anti-sigma factor
MSPQPLPDGRSGGDSPLHIGISRALGTVVVTLRGSLGRDDAEALRAVLKDLIDDQGNLKLVVDLYRLSHLDLSGVLVLRVAAGWARSRGASLRFGDPSSRLSSALRAAGLAESFLFSRTAPTCD